MIYKILLSFLFVCFFIKDLSYGQKDRKFFRKDYKYLSNTEAFYKIHTLPKTWSEAKKTCTREGATFFYPENEEETHAVLEFWNNTQSPIEGMFVGISAVLAKGVFETVDGKLAVDVYNNWYPGEPDDAGGDEDCVILRQGGSLKDDKCFVKYPFICKKTLQSLEWNQKCNTPDLKYTVNDKLGSCYKIQMTPLNWTEAYAVCRIEQSYLTVVNSEQEADYLVGLLKTAALEKVKGEFCKDSVHLGFHNRANDGWQTFSGIPLEETGFVRWADQEPSGVESESCGGMSYSGYLHQISCGRRCLFICEREVDASSGIPPAPAPAPGAPPAEPPKVPKKEDKPKKG